MPDLDPIVQKIGTQYDNAGLMAFASDLGMVSGVALAAAAAVALVTGASVEAVKTTLDWGESLKDVQLKLGGTTEQAAGYKLMSDAAGMSVDDFTRSLDLMDKNLALVSGKEGNAAKEMDNMHITYRNADGTLMESTVIFQNIADKLSLMQDGQEKTRIEMDIFGRYGAQMGILLENAANGGMQKYIDQAKAMGLALSDSQVEQIKRLNEDLNTMKDQFTGIAVILGSAMIPAVDALVGWVEKLVTQMTPAISQFGAWLQMVLGVPAAVSTATSAVATMTGNDSPWYKMGTDVKGFAKGDLYEQSNGAGGFNYNIGKPVEVTVTNVAAFTGGTSTGTGHDFGAGGMAAFVGTTPFEQAIMSFVTSVKNDWPPFETTISSMVAGLAPVDWKTFGTDMVTVVTGLDKILQPILSSLNVALQLADILGIAHDPKNTDMLAGMEGGNYSYKVTGTGGQSFADLMGKNLPGSNNGIPAPVKDTDVLTKLDTYNTGNVGLVATSTNTSAKDLKTSVDAQAKINANLQTSIDKVNTTMLRLPALITAAVATGK